MLLRRLRFDGLHMMGWEARVIISRRWEDHRLEFYIFVVQALRRSTFLHLS